MSSQANYGGLKQRGGRQTFSHSQGLNNKKLSAFQTQSVKRGHFVFNKLLLPLKHICPLRVFSASLLGNFKCSKNITVLRITLPITSCE